MRILSVVLLLFFPLASLFAREEGLPIADGEQMHYTVLYKCGFSADLADISFYTIQEGNLLHSTIRLQSRKRWDHFFQFRDLYEARYKANAEIDPHWFHRDVKERNYTVKAWYDWADDGSIRMSREKQGRAREDTVVRDERKIRDIVNSIYYLRLLDYEKLLDGETVSIYSSFDFDLYLFTIKKAVREKKTIEGKVYHTIRLSVEMEQLIMDSGGVLSERRIRSEKDGKSRFTVWISDDQNKLPLYFQISLKLGSIHGRLSMKEGIKYPLNVE